MIGPNFKKAYKTLRTADARDAGDLFGRLQALQETYTSQQAPRRERQPAPTGL